MHELAITQNILEIALRHADEAQAQKISNLYIVIGQLSSVIDDSVQFYWDIITDGTKAEGAKLHFRRIPTELMCKSCNHKYTPDGKGFSCPECQSIEVYVVSGEEFFLEAIDIEKDNPGVANA
ncbi:hydrogenase maturation nickel metallochaperone HypA [Chloroflexota bacterium]